MLYDDGAPCRHRGAPSDGMVDSVVELLTTLGHDEAFLKARGLTSAEYDHALPAAVQRLRGSMAASNRERRAFVEGLVKRLVRAGVVKAYDTPKYGKDTVYRLRLPDGFQVAIVQKGCPDGAHSSVNWSRPDWADELYLWWVCDSTAAHPGYHIWKGVGRVRGKVSQAGADQLDGLIFYSRQCGTAERPCPKVDMAIAEGGHRLPPPCIYVSPQWDAEPRLNWRGSETRRFPALLLQAWGIDEGQANNYIGYVGFKRGGSSTTTEVTSVALYNEEKVIEVFMRRDGATYTNAREHFEFNVIGGWSGDGTPAFATLLDPVG